MKHRPNRRINAAVLRGQQFNSADRIASNQPERRLYSVRRPVHADEASFLGYLSVSGFVINGYSSERLSLSLLSAKQAKIIAQKGPYSISKMKEVTFDVCNDLPPKLTGFIERVTVFGEAENSVGKTSYVALIPNSDMTAVLTEEAALIASRLGRPLRSRINPHLSIVRNVENTEYAFEIANELNELLAQPEIPNRLILGKSTPTLVKQ